VTLKPRIWVTESHR